MRRFALLVLVLGSLGACKREPSFDERYDAANATIERTVRDIDAQIIGAPPTEAAGDPGTLVEGNPDDDVL